MIKALFLNLLILFSSGYSKDINNCRKIGEMNNNINGQSLYSMGVYMCLELPTQEISPPKTTLLENSKPGNFSIDKILSNSSESNSENITNLKNQNETLITFTNSSNVIKNDTSPSPLSNLFAPSPSPSSESLSPSPFSSYYITPSPSSTTPSSKTTTPSIETTTTPSPKKPPDITTPSSITINNNIEPVKHVELNNTQNNSPYSETPSTQVNLESNPLLPIVIILLSVILLVICSGIGFYIYKRKKEGKIFANNKKKSDEKEEPDIESGEKKNRNSWAFSHKNNAQQKLRALEQFKKRGKGPGRGLKPKLAKIPVKQQQTTTTKRVGKPPNPQIATKALSGLKKEQKKRVRETLLEQAQKMPRGKDNPRIKKLLEKFPEDSPTQNMDGNTKKWYKEEFQAELDHLDILNNQPLTPPPPLPAPNFKQQTQAPIRKVYGNPQNNKSPKMTINEVNPESPIRN
tara:strand:- start:1238 stop:2620 length:1383 start_codon:yes stop_codon:yes gene_type:complete